MPVDVEHAHTLARGATASVVKAKVRKWSAKKSPAAEATHHKRHCAGASSSDNQLAGTAATVMVSLPVQPQLHRAEVNKPDVELQ